MIHRTRALMLALALVSGPALAGHDHWDADPVDARYGGVGHCGGRVGQTIVGAYPSTVIYGQQSIRFPVNNGGSVQYYDARTGGRYVGPQTHQVTYGNQLPYGGAYNAYHQINQAYGAYNNQIQYHQFNGNPYAGGNPYVGVNPWNGHVGNTYNGYTYTPQPYGNGAYGNGVHPAGCSCCATRRTGPIYRSGGAGNWMWNRR